MKIVMSFITTLINGLFTPVRLLLPHDFANKMGLDSIRDDRNTMVLKYVKGQLLDVGCGTNVLVKGYGSNGIGVDIYDFGGGATLISDASKLPFSSAAFDTVTFVASFNHIPNREAALKEIDRLLRKDGIIIITVLSPLIGKLRHRMHWIDRIEEKRLQEKKQEGEAEGLSHRYLVTLLLKYNYRLTVHRKFMLFLNNLYIFERAEGYDHTVCDNNGRHRI